MTHVTAFGYSQDLEPFDTGWHSHDTHQLLYSASGTLLLEVEDCRWLLPPQRAAWIRAGVQHTVQASRAIRLRTVYFDPSHDGPDVSCCVFSINALGREMILHAMRWPEVRQHDGLSEDFFSTLVGLCREWSLEPLGFRLQRPRSDELRRAMAYALEHLEGSPSLGEAARVAGVSTRTLTRRFNDETQTTWRQFLHAARMIRAMELLSVPGARVTETAFAVGFESLGAFSQAFRQFVGETPSAFRQRVGQG